MSVYPWYSAGRAFNLSPGLAHVRAPNMLARYAPCSLVFDDRMWIIGGASVGTTDGTSDVWYSVDGVNWYRSTHNAFPSRWGAQSWVYDNKMWIAGGRITTYGAFNDVWYSEDGETWVEATSEADWTGRSHACAWVYDDKMWIGFGRQNYTVLDVGALHDVWYSEDGETWTDAEQETFTTGLFGPHAWVYNDKMVAGTGATDLFGAACSSSDGVTWAVDSTYSDGRAASAFATFDGSIWLIGGFHSPSFLNEVLKNSGAATWTTVTSSAPWYKRYEGASWVYDEKLWMGFGFGSKTGSSGKPLSDVWYTTNGIQWTQTKGEAPT